MRRGTSWLLLAVILALLVVIVSDVSPQSQAAVPEVYRDTITLRATGEAGAATGTATSTDWIRGNIRAVHVDYGGSVAGSTDITITTTAPAVTVMNLLNTATDAWYYPAVQYTGANGAGLSVYKAFPIDDRLAINATESTSGTVAVITVFYGD